MAEVYPITFSLAASAYLVAEVMSAVLKRWGWNAAISRFNQWKQCSLHQNRLLHTSKKYFLHFSSPSHSKPVLAMLSYRRQLMAETLSSISCTEPSHPGRKLLSKWKRLSAFHSSAISVLGHQEPSIFRMNLIKYQKKKCSQQKIGFYDEEAG